MSAVKEKFLNNIRYADRSPVIDMYEFPDEPLTDEERQEMAEDHDDEDMMCFAEHMHDQEDDR